MPNLLAMSFDGPLAPSFDLRCVREGNLPDGWGLGYYPGGEPSAVVLKEAAPPKGSIRSTLVETWEHLEASTFLLHIRTAKWGQNTDANTQPFERSLGGRDWLIAHAGSLRRRFSLSTSAPPPAPLGRRAPMPRYEPVGSTDTELIFCEVLNRVADLGARSLGEVGYDVLHGWLEELNEHGATNVVLTDGHDLVAYADRSGEGALHLWELRPPYTQLALGDADLSVDLTRRGVKPRKGVIVSTEPLTVTGHFPFWAPLAPGELVVVRQGALRERLAPRSGPRASARTSAPRMPVARPVVQEPKTLRVVHRTTYRYTTAVERSVHRLRLVPVHDRKQTLLEHDLSVSVDGASRDYDDVFGNQARRMTIDRPYSELEIVARSTVRVLDTDPLRGFGVHRRSSIPLVWMPWQRETLQPYLLPQELPDTQLAELSEYAMSFVERNDYDLLDTLIDLNRSIYREYAYAPGTTTLATTPFDTYHARRGVCQDFTNLFICLARLLSVPARYVCGYVYTGPKNPNQIQGEASHAWLQVFLPEHGWCGFDPTNGILTQTDHVRVAVGRNFVDATPTAGTIYVGGGGETLEVEVRVDDVT